MAKGIFRLGLNDLGKGLLVAIGTAVVLYLQTLMGQTGFTFSALPWQAILNIAISAGIGYLAKQLLTSDQGNIGGIGDIK